MGSPALEEFLKEFHRNLDKWTRDLRGWKHIGKHEKSREAAVSVEKTIAIYERRLVLMGDGKVIRLQELIEDGYPEMEVIDVSVEVYTEMTGQLEDEAVALMMWKIEGVPVSLPSHVRVKVLDPQETS